MKIDLEHLHYWMCAIRNSEDPKRTLDAFWRGQIDSKMWLIDNLKPFVKTPALVDINGGWAGVLASLMFQSDLPIKSIRSIDIDPSCQPIATMMNKAEEMQRRFMALTGDMCDIQPTADIIINTSCEHITQEQYNRWLKGIPNNKLLVLQSNNYFIPEHIRPASSLEEFKSQCGDLKILWTDELHLPLYTRFMIVARPN